MSLAVDVPDVIVKPGRMLGGAPRARLAGLAACLVLWAGALLLAKSLYIQEMRLPRLALLAENTGQLISRLQGLDQRLIEELDLMDAAYPPSPHTYTDY